MSWGVVRGKIVVLEGLEWGVVVVGILVGVKLMEELLIRFDGLYDLVGEEVR